MKAGWPGARVWARMSSWLRSVPRTLPQGAEGSRLDREMEEEIRFHLESRAADLERDGMEPREAMRHARLEFGAAAAHKDAMRRALGLRWWDELWADLHYAGRILRKSYGFTLIAVGSLALAIGANTTIFSLANELLYERLGVPHPEQLRLLTLSGDKNVLIHSMWGDGWPIENGRTQYDSFTYPVFRQMQADTRGTVDVFAFKDLIRLNVTVDGNAQAASAELVSGNLYEEMKVRPAAGRTLLPADDGEPGTGAVAMISDGFWSRNFGRSPDAVGKVIRVNTIPVTIVGVNPRGFTGAQSVQQAPELFLPLSMMPLLQVPMGDSGPLLSSTSLWWVQMMMRKNPGLTDEQARAALDAALNAAVRGTMHVEKDQTMPQIVVEDGSRGLNHSARQFAKPMHVLLGLVGGVLLLACANMANLMLARASVRKREMSVRLALGASRGRILRQVLTESLLIAGIGGALGLELAYLGRSVLPGLLAGALEQGTINVLFDWRIFAFSAAITIGTGVLFGVAPAWVGMRAEIGGALKQGEHTASRQRKGWSGRAIVSFQVALSTLLVVAAGLFLATLAKLNRIDPGFRPDHLVVFEISPPSQRYGASKGIAVHQKLEEALRGVPGVEGVTAMNIPLLAGGAMNGRFFVEGEGKGKFADRDIASYPFILNTGTDFFSVMKVPLLAGRSFNRQDTESSPRVAVINQSLAQKYFPGVNPIGRRFSPDGPEVKDRRWVEIIGVCGNTLYDSLRRQPPLMHFDLYQQQGEAGSLSYMVRTGMKPEAIVPSLRDAVRKVDGDLPLMNIRTEEEQIAAGLAPERMFACLTAGFGLLALMLACVGIYGIMAYTVSQRRNEIGIRLALGAERAQVRGMVLREAAWLAGAGIVCGLGAAIGLSQLVRSLLYGLEPSDPGALAGAAAMLLVVALGAGWIPAMQASKVEPMEALRHE